MSDETTQAQPVAAPATEETKKDEATPTEQAAS
jgi:hypothetical protein